MTETTHEQALRLADALVEQAIKETEARCTVLALFIDDCDRAGSRVPAWGEAHRELRALQDRRSGLKLRHDLIQQALQCSVAELPAKVPLSPPNRPVVRTQRQIQIRRR